MERVEPAPHRRLPGRRRPTLRAGAGVLAPAGQDERPDDVGRRRVLRQDRARCGVVVERLLPRGERVGGACGLAATDRLAEREHLGVGLLAQPTVLGGPHRVQHRGWQGEARGAGAPPTAPRHEPRDERRDGHHDAEPTDDLGGLHALVGGPGVLLVVGDLVPQGVGVAVVEQLRHPDDLVDEVVGVLVGGHAVDVRRVGLVAVGVHLERRLAVVLPADVGRVATAGAVLQPRGEAGEAALEALVLDVDLDEDHLEVGPFGGGHRLLDARLVGGGDVVVAGEGGIDPHPVAGELVLDLGDRGVTDLVHAHTTSRRRDPTNHRSRRKAGTTPRAPKRRAAAMPPPTPS